MLLESLLSLCRDNADIHHHNTCVCLKASKYTVLHSVFHEVATSIPRVVIEMHVPRLTLVHRSHCMLPLSQ